ncbi:MAG: ABC transporter permease subunit [Acidimicrobiales bacterium]|nr:ABC transporter permease subunit [Acidimicrobiales bacterium]
MHGIKELAERHEVTHNATKQQSPQSLRRMTGVPATDVGQELVDPIIREQLLAQQVATADRRDSVVRAVRRILVFVVFVFLLGLLYTAYKAFGSSIDDAQSQWPVIGSVLPRADDLNMPPISDIVSQFGERRNPEANSYARILLGEALFTLREAAVGFLVGGIVGLGIAIALARSRWLDKGLLPYIIASQTIPLIAIAPIVVVWGRKNLDFFPWEWQDWMSVSIIATYLTFFPIAVNGLRGLQSPTSAEFELMSSYAATWNQTLWRLRFPAAVPHLFAAFKIAASGSVVGAIVGEISAGVTGGLGRRLLNEAFNYTTGPQRLYASVIGAALLGITVFLVVTATERVVLAKQNRESI